MPRAERNARSRTRCAPAGLALMLVVAVSIGCSNPNRPTVAPIQFVDATGGLLSPVTTLAVNQPVYMVATVSNDNDFLGVSWTVACGSTPSTGAGGTVISTACGVCNPAQTASGPVPTYPSTGIITTYTAPSAIPKGSTVTISANVTSLPSVFSSVTLTIVDPQSASSAIGLSRGALVPLIQDHGL
jgi:hypothetical protein